MTGAQSIPAHNCKSEYFETTAEYDALNRVTHSPHHTIKISPPVKPGSPITNPARSILSMWRFAAATRKTYVSNIDYDAKGQRQKIEYGNGVITTYEYEDDTYRLKRLLTIRNANENLQDLNYFYDPAGNISEIRDYAQSTIYYDNALVEPHSNYVYDPLYRLIEASGREHATQANIPHPGNGWEALQATDDLALQNYIQSYEYDSVGNILLMAHRRPNDNNSGWTRNYDYDQTSNRLLGTTLGDPASGFDEYSYNEHGSMTRMPHLQGSDPNEPALDWDFAEQLQHVDLIGGGDAWYVYDGSGQRTRKIIETNGITVKERIYLGGWEIYRETVSGSVKLERETQHVMDDQNRIALIETKTVSESVQVSSPIPVVRYQLGNHLGSASLELSDVGDVISYEEFHPYGTTAYHAGSGVVEGSAKRYRYTGMERDEESGFSYHGARYYVGWLGRWSNADPAGIIDGINIYAYSHNRPTILTDPTGYDSGPDGDEIARVLDKSEIVIDEPVPFSDEDLLNMKMSMTADQLKDKLTFSDLSRLQKLTAPQVSEMDPVDFEIFRWLRINPIPKNDLIGGDTMEWKQRWESFLEELTDRETRSKEEKQVTFTGIAAGTINAVVALKFGQDAGAAQVYVDSLQGQNISMGVKIIARETLTALQEFEANPSLVMNQLSQRQIDAIARSPRLASVFFGTALQSRVNERLVAGGYSGIFSTGGSAPVDWMVGRRNVGVDLTGGSERSFQRHFERENVRVLITHDIGRSYMPSLVVAARQSHSSTYKLPLPVRLQIQAFQRTQARRAQRRK